MVRHLLHMKHQQKRASTKDVEYCTGTADLLGTDLKPMRDQITQERRNAARQPAIKVTEFVSLDDTETELAKRQFARLLFRSDSPFRLANHECWSDLFKFLHVNFKQPSRKVVSHRLLDLEYSEVQGKVKEKLATFKVHSDWL